MKGSKRSSIISKSQKLDEDFHLALAKASGNSILLQVVELLGHIFLRSRDEYSQSPDRRRLSIKGHQGIVKAIKELDSKTAKELMADHLSEIRKLVLSSDFHKEK